MNFTAFALKMHNPWDPYLRLASASRVEVSRTILYSIMLFVTDANDFLRG